MTHFGQHFQKLQKCFCKNCYSSGALGGAVFIFPVYLKDIVFMIPTDFFVQMSNGSKDIAIYDKFQNGGHVVSDWLFKSYKRKCEFLVCHDP